MKENSKISKRRGRPRKFESDEVLRTLTDVFWKQGYAGTSIEMLSEAARLARPSLYAEFGDKEQMYLASLHYFLRHMGKRIEEESTKEGPLEDVLLGIYDALIDLYTGGDDFAKGCMVVCTATSEAIQSERIREMLCSVLEQVDKNFEKKLLAAKKSGHLAPSANPKLLASVLGGITHSLAVRARSGASKASLHRLARDTIKLVLADH